MNEPTTKEEALSLISNIADKFNVNYRILKSSQTNLDELQCIMSAAKFIEAMRDKTFLPPFSIDPNYGNWDWQYLILIENQYNSGSSFRHLIPLYYYGYVWSDKTVNYAYRPGVSQRPQHAINFDSPAFYPILVYNE